MLVLKILAVMSSYKCSFTGSLHTNSCACHAAISADSACCLVLLDGIYAQ
jgi:hypothetical protein